MGRFKRGMTAASFLMATVAVPGVAHGNLMDKIAPYLPIPSDTIEMARFTINHSKQSGEIFQHAAEQDYVYFAIIGGIKIARKNGLTQSQCMLPLTVVDKAFGFAESTVSNATGKQKTNTLVDAAKNYAGQYAKAVSNEAKKKIKEAMTENIPYLKDLETMCSFAFATNFKTFDDYYELAGAMATNVVHVYNELSDGEYVDAVADLITLGLTGKTACKLIDDAVSGGMISRTPILGDLVIGACNGFVGAVLDGVKHVVKGGIGMAKAAAAFAAESGEGIADGFQGMGCDVFGVGCGNRVLWAEFVPIAGQSYCASHKMGAMADFSIAAKATKPGENPPGAFTCGNGTTCVIPPFPVPSCISLEQKAEVRKMLRGWADKKFTQDLAVWSFAYNLSFNSSCLDDICRGSIGLNRKLAEDAARKAHDLSPFDGLSKVGLTTLEPAKVRAFAIINEGRFRNWPKQWAEKFDLLYPDQCESDQKCRTALNFVRAGTLAAVQQVHDSKPNAPYLFATISIFVGAKKQADAIVANVKPRLQAEDLEATKTGAAAMGDLAVITWSKRCADALCNDEVNSLAGKMQAFQKLTQIGQPTLSPAEVQAITTKQFGPRFQALIDQSKARAAAAAAIKGVERPKPPIPGPTPRVPPVVRPLPPLRR